MMEMARIRDGVLDYATERVLPKLSPGRQFVAGAALGLVAARADALMQELAKNELIKASGLMTENGMVDIDAVYEAAMVQMRRQRTLPVDIPMLGRMTFDESDLTELYRYIAAR